MNHELLSKIVGTFVPEAYTDFSNNTIKGRCSECGSDALVETRKYATMTSYKCGECNKSLSNKKLVRRREELKKPVLKGLDKTKQDLIVLTKENKNLLAENEHLKKKISEINEFLIDLHKLLNDLSLMKSGIYTGENKKG